MKTLYLILDWQRASLRLAEGKRKWPSNEGWAWACNDHMHSPWAQPLP